jgi:hypothetical protein
MDKPEMGAILTEMAGGGTSKGVLLGSQSVENILRTGCGLRQMRGNNSPLVIVQRGYPGENAAQCYGYIIDIVHQADCFSGEWHGGGPLKD